MMYDAVSMKISRQITRSYSTSFSIATGFLSPHIRDSIYAIYAFVRVADEIVDTFHEYPKEELLIKFEKDYYDALKQGISVNPVLHSFQMVVKKFDIPDSLVQAFLKSMKTDLKKSVYNSESETSEYIYGSADVVGLMCLKVFTYGTEGLYEELREAAMKLGSAFQKVNFLRDIRNDTGILKRYYYPGTDNNNFNEDRKKEIVTEIKSDFAEAKEGIRRLPSSSRLGVEIAYEYYIHLLRKLERTPAEKLMKSRLRVTNIKKLVIFIKVYTGYKLSNS